MYCNQPKTKYKTTQTHHTQMAINQRREKADVSQCFTSATTGGVVSTLFVACALGHSSVVGLLISAGADVNHVSTNPDGTDETFGSLGLFATPLMMATHKGDMKSAELLLAAGATVATQMPPPLPDTPPPYNASPMPPPPPPLYNASQMPPPPLSPYNSGFFFSGALGKSSSAGFMAKLTYNMRYVTLKGGELVLRYHENHGAFTGGAEPKGEVDLKACFQSYSVVPESQRYQGMHGIELKFTSRSSFCLWSTEGPDRFQGLIKLLPQSK